MARVVPSVLLLALAASPPAADDVEVLFDGAEAGAWDPARDAERIRRELSRSELAIEGSPPALAWRFVSRGVPFNDLLGMHDLYTGEPIGDGLRSFEADFPPRGTRIFALR